MYECILIAFISILLELINYSTKSALMGLIKYSDSSYSAQALSYSYSFYTDNVFGLAENITMHFP